MTDEQYDELRLLALSLKCEPYFYSHWTKGGRGWEVGGMKSRNRVCADMSETHAKFFSLLDPATVLYLIERAQTIDKVRSI